MSATVEIDKTGRIVIPKKLRDAMHLTPGTSLKLRRSGHRLVLEQDFPEPQLIMKDGMWVMAGGTTLTNDDVTALIQQGYEERHKRIMEGSGLE